MQKLVKGATKPKATAPKAKYVEPILASTYEGGHDFEVVMDSLAKVIGSRSGSWPSIYKALIVIHLMIREGSEYIALEYLARHPRMLDIEDHIHRAPAMGRYARYLATRGQQFKETKVDHVRYKSRQGYTRLHSLTIQKGLMRECNSVLIQLEALMKCQYQEQDIVNDDVLLMAFRLLVHDALSLFQVLNEGVINLLEHFFELSKPDAEQALDIYRGFRRITSKVIQFLRTAKDLEFKTMLHVPNIKHAPTSLVSSLEMYLNDPEFEHNHRQYLEEKKAHEIKRSHSQTQSKPEKRTVSTASAPPPSTGGSVASSFPQPVMVNAQISNSQPVQSVQQPIQQPVQAQAQPAAQQPSFVPDSSQVGNPFWQSQNEAANIQTVDGQTQLHMQQLHQLQMQQVEQQQRIRQQIQQLEQQQQQMQQQQQPPQPIQPQQTQTLPQQTPFFDSANQFDFGLQPAPPTQYIPQTNFEAPQPQPQPQPSIQQVPQYLQQQPTAQYLQQQPTAQYLQQQHTAQQQQQQFLTQQHTAQQLQPQVQQVQPQQVQQAQQEHNPFKRLSTGTSPQAPLNAYDTGTNPFKSPNSTFAAQFSALDSVGNQMQPSLIDFGQPPTQLSQTTGTNPFRL